MKKFYFLFLLALLFATANLISHNAYYNAIILSKVDIKYLKTLSYNYKVYNSLVEDKSDKISDLDIHYFNHLIDFLQYPISTKKSFEKLNDYISNRFAPLYAKSLSVNKQLYEHLINNRNDIKKQLNLELNKIKNEINIDSLKTYINNTKAEIDKIKVKIGYEDSVLNKNNNNLFKIFFNDYFRDLKEPPKFYDDYFINLQMNFKVDSDTLGENIIKFKSDKNNFEYLMISLENVKKATDLLNNRQNKIEEINAHINNHDLMTKSYELELNSLKYDFVFIENQNKIVNNINYQIKNFNDIVNEKIVEKNEPKSLQTMSVEAISGIIIDRFESSYRKFLLSTILEELKNKKLDKILPKSFEILNNENNFRYDFLDRLKLNLDIDFSRLPGNIIKNYNHVDSIEYKIFKSLHTLFSYKSDLDFFQMMELFIEINKTYDLKDSDFNRFYHSLRLGYRIIQGLSVAGDNGNLLKPITIKELTSLNEIKEIIYFISLLTIDDPRSKLILDLFPNNDFSNINFTNLEQVDKGLIDNFLKKYDDYFKPKFIELLTSYQVIVDNNRLPIDKLNSYFRIVKAMFSFYCEDIKKFKEIDSVIQSFQELTIAIENKQYLGILSKYFKLLRDIKADTIDFKYDKYLNLIEKFTFAKTSAEVKEVLESFITEESDAYQKRETFAIVISSSIGLGLSKESINKLDEDSFSSNLSIPLGFELANINCSKDILKIGFNFQILDLTAPVSYLFNGENKGLPSEVTFSQFFAPGVTFNLISLNSIPIDFGVFCQYNPQLRKFGDPEGKPLDTYKIGLKASWDLPLVLLYKN